MRCVIVSQNGSCPFVKIKFKDFQGPYKGYTRSTGLNQTDTYISIYMLVQFMFDNLTPVNNLFTKKISVSNSNDEVYSTLRLRQH